MLKRDLEILVDLQDEYIADLEHYVDVAVKFGVDQCTMTAEMLNIAEALNSRNDELKVEVGDSSSLVLLFTFIGILSGLALGVVI